MALFKDFLLQTSIKFDPLKFFPARKSHFLSLFLSPSVKKGRFLTTFRQQSIPPIAFLNEMAKIGSKKPFFSISTAVVREPYTRAVEIILDLIFAKKSHFLDPFLIKIGGPKMVKKVTKNGSKKGSKK